MSPRADGPGFATARAQIDGRWAATATALHLIERYALSRNSLFAAAVDGGIRAQAGVRRAQAAYDETRRPGSRIVNWHEGGSGPAVVLVNGWTASGLVWPQAFVAALERGHRVLRIDNRGAGWSRGLHRPFTIADMAGDVRRLLDELAIERATVAGLSMGGMIAQEMALRSPDRVEHLVLIGTRPPVPEYTPPPASVTARLMAPPAEGEPLREFMRRRWDAVTAPGFAAEHPDVMGAMVRSIVARPMPRGAVLDQARAIAAWSGAGRLRRLAVPATVVHGELDPLVPVRNGMRLAQLIPGARYVELPGVGHLVPFEAPFETAAAISRS